MGSWTSSVGRAWVDARSGRRGGSKRRDIQGLRALAVVLVVVNHLTGRPVGGFVGVDVFFVISGFLITGLLVRDLVDGSGETMPWGEYLWAFYRRRIRRILPAALTVTVLTVVVARIELNTARFTQAWHDGLWATVFWANWHFAQAGTDYFAAHAAPSPFQHYWSLSVEEQFYVVWPVLLLVAALLLGRTGPAARLRAGAVGAGLLSVVSLGVAAVLSGSDATSAYFSTWTRAWELGLGALLACVMPRLPRHRGLSIALSWTGLGLILLSAFVVHGQSGFPFPGAVLPCVGTAMALAAVTPRGESAPNPVLTNPGSVWLGDLSYSLYLVHFPVLVLLGAEITDHSASFYAATTALTLGLAVALHEYVEQPVLRSSWLQSSRSRRSRTTGLDLWADTRPVVGLLSVGLVAVAAVLWSTWSAGQSASAAHQQDLISRSVQAQQQGPATSARRKHRATPQLDRLEAANAAALTAHSWPVLAPSLDQVLSGPAMPADEEQCSGTSLGIASSCTFGNPHARHTFEVVGDSNAATWEHTFRTLVAADPGWNVRLAAGFACQFADTVIVQNAGDYTSHCAARNQAVVQDIRAGRPDVLVVTNLNTYSANEPSVRREIAKVRSSVGTVVILGPPPVTKNPAQCYTPGSSPQDCVSQLDPTYPQTAAANRGLAHEVAGVSIDVTRWFAVGRYVPPFSGRLPTRYDAGHMSSVFAARLAPVLRETLVAAHVMAR